ncbi:MAG: DsrE family protein [Bacteroidia bacterium]
MEKLNILWITDNKDTVFNMLVMYATNSKIKGWWEEVNLIIWGASAKLVGSDTEVQNAISEMISHGIHIEACKKCSDNFGVTETLVNLGITVKYMGEPLTNYIKSGEKVLTV